MTTMLQTENKLLLLFHELLARYPDRIAGPFFSVAPANYDPMAVPSILYVGKATAGPWGLSDFLSSPTVTERHEFTTDFLEEINTGEYSSAFWRFAHDLSDQIALTSGRPIHGLQNLVWTNLCKIGVVRNNPSGEILQAQGDLATEFLRLEIQTYRPKLIVLVTGDYADHLVTATFGEQIPWHKECGPQGFWWREAANELPAILWTYHPQNKRQKLLETWLKQASQLLVLFLFALSFTTSQVRYPELRTGRVVVPSSASGWRGLPKIPLAASSASA